MKNLALIALLSSMTFSLAHATTAPCNGFKIVVKNETNDTLVIKRAEILGAQLQPQIQQISPNSKQIFTINAQEGNFMKGNILMNTDNFSGEEVNLMFELESGSVMCEHHDYSTSSLFELSKTRWLGGVHYTIKK